jgi:SAM-dependent methyltransferase
VDGYDAATYGDRFAEVYDDWYGTLTDTDACVSAIADLAEGGPVLELGVGTGRLAIPLAARGLAVTGVDASPAMLSRLAAKPGGDRVTAVLGDMADPQVGDARFATAFVAYNTLFNLVDLGDQQRCLANVARLLRPGGHLVVEAFVPDPDLVAGDRVAPRRVSVDRVVLSVSRSEPERQEVSGQYVDITEAGIRLRPWQIRWSTPQQLDDMAVAAGLELAERWSTWGGDPFTADADAHVSRYRRSATE